MASERGDIDRRDMTPFLLRLFYRTGSYHSPHEFLTLDQLPSHQIIYTWTNCTLRELSTHLAASDPSPLPSPPLGTRLCFRLFYPDAKAVANANAPANFIARDIGSVVLGADLPGVADYDTIMSDAGGAGSPHTSLSPVGPDPFGRDRPYTQHDGDEQYGNSNGNGYGGHDDYGAGGVEGKGMGPPVRDDGDMTLQEAKFVIGDYISVAILPPGADGSVAQNLPPPPVSSAPPLRTGRGRRNRGPKGAFGAGGGGGGGGFGGDFGGGGGYGMGGGPGAGGGGGGGGEGGGRRRRGGRGGRQRGGDDPFSSSNTVPVGEWRRGEQIPPSPRTGGGGGGGGGGGRRGRR